MRTGEPKPRRLLIVGHAYGLGVSLAVGVAEQFEKPGPVVVSGTGDRGGFVFRLDPRAARELAELLVCSASSAERGNSWVSNE